MPEVEKVKEDEEDKPGKLHKKTRSFLNKVVIRKLPPTLTAENFIETIAPLPDDIDFYFVPADWSLGAEATSRAYIEFKNEEDIFIFRDKFDGYVFVDSVRGSEYQAIVEYAAFQGLPKSRARKKDKNLGTIESEQHFLDFLEQLKVEEADSQKNEPKLEYSYQIKDDKRITSTPLIEFLAAKNQEKRDAKRKKIEEKKKQRDEEKQKKKIQVAKNVPEPIKETKEDAVYEDGIMVRTVPSRLSRNDRKKEPKSEAKPEKESGEKERDRREKRENEKADREARKKLQKEKDERRKLEREQRDQQKAKNRDQQKPSGEGEKSSSSAPAKESNKEAPAKNETKRYSALRKARQEKSSEVKEPTDVPQQQAVTKEEIAKIEPKVEEKHESSPEEIAQQEAKKEARLKRAQEQRERRAREADERAQRHIKNKDRPTLQFYQPKRRPDSEAKSDNLKSSDENSEASRKRSDNDRRNDKRERRPDKKPSRKNSRDETGRKKKTSCKNSDEGVEDAADAGKGEVKDETIVKKLEQLVLDPPRESPEAARADEAACVTSKDDAAKESGDVQE